MTEAEWLACGAPMKLLEHVGGTALDRKRRLLGCGLGRHVWPVLRDARSRTAIEVAERFADGAATDDEREAAEADAQAVMKKARKYNRNRNRYECFGTAVGAWAAGTEVRHWGVGDDAAADPAGGPARDTPVWEDAAEAMYSDGAGWHGELGWFCDVIRCVFGNQYRHATFNPRSSRKKAVAFAQAIYDERAFDRLPALADILQEMGYEDPAVLAHCRSAGPHVRGCWVVDLVLGKS
ncbi:hypothetical protein [Limnoglobus roseus]|uniref:SMI1/KNR4 family protein n=1 Tax=Limnoglobus roseus TaxID=2598579 RepID=A0A5C1A8F9_9BACT|nr:hypothetical protein [Limnoglobus roseus]QEL13424.1 hypothetical protein PX52LOC_00279 [Limnoglobus roseus]